MNSKKQFVFILMVAAMVGWVGCTKPENPEVNPPATDTVTQDSVPPEEPADNIYQFKVLDGNGDSVSLKDYRGKVLLVVNTATQCGYTPQYTDLERIYKRFHDSGFEVLDFPCNQFGGQASGTYDDIHNFCTSRYNITFPQFDKIDVNGANASPLYVWLKSKKPGNIRWNFTKFLIDRNGEVIDRFEPEKAMSAVETAVGNAM